MKSENTQNGIELARPDSAVSDGYEFWSIQGKPVSIHLRSSVAGQIRAMADLQPVAGIPVENGGILWGRVRDVADEYFIVSIEEADCVPCDHDRGEGWVPSMQDRRDLKKHLKRKNGDLRPVGFWRAHRRRGLYLDKRDLDLMEVFFPQPWSVALCVRPPATAGFFIWENGDIRRSSTYREFQLPDAGQLAVVPMRPSSTPWKRWTAIGTLAAAITIAPFLIVKSTDRSTPFNVLSMRAHTKPGVVRLSWDARSKLLRAADSAIIWIADGADESKLELTAGQVRAGSIEYKPANSNVNFRMQVGQFMESLSVDAMIPQGSSPPMVAVSHPPPEPAPEPVADRQRSRKVQPRAARKVELPSPVRHTFVRPQPLEVPSPPQIALAPKLDRPNLPQRSDDVPKISATVEKPGSSPFKKVFGWMIPGRKKDFVPAKPVRQFQPQVNSGEPVSVAVRVEIDQRGVVQDADLMTKSVSGPVGRSAVAAAKRWRFEPAREKDRPVASSMVVKFNFGGEKNP